MCDGRATVAQIAATLGRRYGGAADVLLADVEGAVQDLTGHDLLTAAV